LRTFQSTLKAPSVNSGGAFFVSSFSIAELYDAIDRFASATGVPKCFGFRKWTASQDPVCPHYDGDLVFQNCAAYKHTAQ